MTLCQGGRVPISIPWKSSTMQSSPTSSSATWWRVPAFITGSKGSRMSKVHPCANMQRVGITSTVKRKSVLRKTLSGYRSVMSMWTKSSWYTSTEQCLCQYATSMNRSLPRSCHGQTWLQLICLVECEVSVASFLARWAERRTCCWSDLTQIAYKKEQAWRNDTAWAFWPVGLRLTVIGSDLCSLMSSEPSNFLMYFALSADSMYWFYILGTTGIETTKPLKSVTPSKSDR